MIDIKYSPYQVVNTNTKLDAVIKSLNNVLELLRKCRGRYFLLLSHSKFCAVEISPMSGSRKSFR